MTYRPLGSEIIVLLMLGLAACQPKPDASAPSAKQSASAQSAQPANSTLPLIEARVVPVKVSKTESCNAQGCTQYDLQTVQTNVAWIDQYFLQRIQKSQPNAFDGKPNQKVNVQPDQPQLNQSSIYVRYLGQNHTIASFALENYTYSAGAAHGLYHQEFVNFDLNKKKRLQLTDVIKPGVEHALLQQLYDANALWLEQHEIDRSRLQLSDNFYYGVNGIIFVYPLYELASYAEGMSELTLPYSLARQLIKTEYLPALPKYPQP